MQILLITGAHTFWAKKARLLRHWPVWPAGSPSSDEQPKPDMPVTAAAHTIIVAVEVQSDFARFIRDMARSP
jgi:hypothetical protein